MALALVIGLAIYSAFFDLSSALNPVQVAIIDTKMTQAPDGLATFFVNVRNVGSRSVVLTGRVNSAFSTELIFNPSEIRPGEISEGIATTLWKVADFAAVGYVNVPNSPSLNPSSLTVEVGFKYRGFDPDQQMVFGKGATAPDSFYFYSFRSVNNINDFVIYTNGTRYDHQLGNIFSLGTWYTLAFALSGNEVDAFVNGELVNSWTHPAMFLGNLNDLLLGKCICSGYHFNGSLSFFRLYDRALSSSEIQRNYALSPTSDGLALWMVFNNTSVTTVADVSGNGNNGTVGGIVSFVPPLSPCDRYSLTVTGTTNSGKEYSLTKGVQLAC